MNENSQSTFTKDNTNKSFRTGAGISFTVLEGEHFPKTRIAAQHRKYLSDLRAGLLVSVSFFGQPVPLITMDDGVVRLAKIDAGGETMTEASVISKVLGITKTRQPVGLSVV